MSRCVAGLILVSLSLFGGLARAQGTVQTSISVLVECSSSGQLCSPPFSTSISTASTLQAKYSVPGHCSSIRVHFFVDGAPVHTSGFLGWPGAPEPFAGLPLDTGLLDFGPLTPGVHSLAVQAEGQVSGCNVGDLLRWGGTLSLVTSNELAISIDIRPGRTPNPVQPGSRGRIPVAIVTTEVFDAADVDPDTVRFGRVGDEAPALHDALEDVDGDGDLDMILHFATALTGIRCGDQTASLSGSTFNGQVIRGIDSIVTVGCP